MRSSSTRRSFANYIAVLGATQQSGPDTVITYDSHDSVTLTGVTASSLTSNNFHFAWASIDQREIRHLVVLQPNEPGPPSNFRIWPEADIAHSAVTHLSARFTDQAMRW
jgi:hypothetical protein